MTTATPEENPTSNAFKSTALTNVVETTGILTPPLQDLTTAAEILAKEIATSKESRTTPSETRQGKSFLDI